MLMAAACHTAAPSHYWYSEGLISRRAIENILRENALALDQNIRLTDLGSTASVSHHLVQLRQVEPNHMHREHDLTIFVYRGTGIMRLGTNEFSIAPGDVIFVPKGVQHLCRNTGSSPAVAIVTFSPGLSGKDFELIPEK
jgi:mannose-6-phosphate isomerase-like protein (cupin superfamily)